MTTDALKVVPSSDTVSTGVLDTAPLAKALAGILADTYRLTFKTHAYHWNIEGPLFFSVHKLTEEQYENTFAAADELAERIRALGHLAPVRMTRILDDSVLEDGDENMDSAAMIADLASDHERIAHRLHALASMAGERRDIVTEDLATARSAFHEQAAWMLRAIVKA